MNNIEALRLADELLDGMSDEHWNQLNADAAAELCRLHAECSDLAHQLNENNERSGRIIAQLDALRADAERYRWLRENSSEYSLTQKDGYGGRELMGWEDLDAAIDAAMRGEK